MQKVTSEIKDFQKEIKDVYSLFKPLIEKWLPHFWDENNYLLKKEAYDNLLVQRRNDHWQLENLKGNLRGEVVVEKLGDTFNIFNQVRRVEFPSPLIEEYIDLEIEAHQLMHIELPSKNQFKEVIKMAVKPVGVILITQWASHQLKTLIPFSKDNCKSKEEE